MIIWWSGWWHQWWLSGWWHQWWWSRWWHQWWRRRRRHRRRQLRKSMEKWLHCFSVVVHCVGWKISMRANVFEFEQQQLWSFSCIFVSQWSQLLTVLRCWFCCCFIVICCCSGWVGWCGVFDSVLMYFLLSFLVWNHFAENGRAHARIQKIMSGWGSWGQRVLFTHQRI